MSQRTNLHARRSRGFTLIELLMVILLLAMLSALALSALSGAQEEARVQRTKAIIAKIDQLIMEKWDGYRTRSVPVALNAGVDPLVASRVRLYALRELQRMELPDAYDDIENNPVILAARPSVSNAYRRKLVAGYTDEYEESECLYLILSAIRDGESSGIDSFTPAEIGDLDDDGMKEILDGWGTPIRFIRWAPGFRSDAISPAIPAVTFQTGNAAVNPDPFDPLKTDPRNCQSTINPPAYGFNASHFPQTGGDTDLTNDTFALVPLIYSYGPNKLGGFKLRSNLSFASTTPRNDPYYVDTAAPAGEKQLGNIRPSAIDDAQDNITNHATQVQL